ncbi:hypothetical protein Pcinc_031191 [Petrolisthes cinctipes]|uniref:Sulfotransferase domain-containing protein n=1 Tax=Petrolisthes cinctipes TaxID=88211 RepID=A0AAE1K1G2_PETCI|nr:hypothetical protein Pcinc_031191 [Petrolisthes cinctipes]
MSEEWLARREKNYVSFNSGMVRILPEGWMYPATAPIYLNTIQDFQFREGDVVIMTMVKSGTTWMQEIVFTMLNNPNLDHPNANQPLWERSMEISFDMNFDTKNFDDTGMAPLYEAFEKHCPGKKKEKGILIQMIETLPGRRVIKCHYPLQVMPSDLLQKAKVVYVARNPKDVVVSFYHFCKVIRGLRFTGTFEQFVKDFLQDQLIYTPYWPHVLEAWRKRDNPNLLFVMYEDLKADNISQLRIINDFLGTNLNEMQLENVARHTSFSSMKSRGEPVKDPKLFLEESKGSFFRKGSIGDWRSHFSPELNAEMDKWIRNNIGDSDITFNMGE